jgi:MFS transporter, putative metabolite:H+ symporter
MALIVAGIGLAGYRLLSKIARATPTREAIAPPEDAPLTRAHWILIAVLAVALVIDIMKPASVGFVTPECAPSTD